MPSLPTKISSGTRFGEFADIPSVDILRKTAAALPAALETVSTSRPDLFPQATVTTLDPGVLSALLANKIAVDAFVPRFDGPQTMTKLAHSAIRNLSDINKDYLISALNTIVNKGIAPNALIDSLEQGVKFNEVMSELAQGWSQATKDNFVQYFSLPSAQLEVMDAIVSLAVLNDPKLEAQLRRENTPQPTPEDLLDGRKVLYQYPPPGSVLDPPYIILLAVEHIDTQAAQHVVNSIMMELADYRVREHTFKVTRAALQKLQ